MRVGDRFLTNDERRRAEEQGFAIIDAEHPNVTREAVRYWSDADLLEWLEAWGYNLRPEGHDRCERQSESWGG